MPPSHGIATRIVRVGRGRAVGLITLASVVTSNAICLAAYAIGGWPQTQLLASYGLPTLVPLVVAPLAASHLVAAFARLDALQAALAREIEERRAAEAALDHLAHHDPLTGLLNRRGLEREVARLRASGTGPLGVVVVDLDGLKALNDRQGHAAGDRAIAAAAAAARAACPRGAVARTGGDEFLAVVDLGAEPLVAAAARLHDAVVGAGTRASAGAATFGAAEPLEDAATRADRALLAAKAAGRGRLVVEGALSRAR